jgi:ATP-dependent RNA helicase HelY
VTAAPDASAGYGFELDGFQRDACAALDDGQSVLVAAPTGSGKTVVAEHAVALALEAGQKIFYTTPIKALSNQKFHDLAQRYGAERVGLLTGDNAVNGDAPVVVMTTEVLRNMIYARSSALDGLLFVVLDEVHYLQDAYRGPVWEEVIIHLPAAVRLVCLSATVSNADELAEWITMVRGPTTTVVETKRPVELVNLYAVEDRTSERLQVVPVLVDGRPNPHGDKFDAAAEPTGRSRVRRKFAPPRRLELLEHLADRDLLPAIYFIFSRNGCDDAMLNCVRAGVRLTEAEERTRIRAIVERHVAGLSDEDLEVLGYDRWAHGLEQGIAAHHAGMVPPFKEAVEEAFAGGLVKVVFATETLALGINMPARTVVIEKLTKFTGERHEFLTPGQYTQLTGRAGRRGIDDIGHAVVLWSPFVPFADVATLASSRSFVLTSSFRPTYNMAANLVRRYPAEVAHRLLNMSFAQFQADHAIVRLEARVEKRREAADRLREQTRCERGDIEEYRRLVDAARRDESNTRRSWGDAIERALTGLKPGDVIRLFGGKNAGRVAVLSVSHRKGTVKVRGVAENRRVLNLTEDDFREPPPIEGHLDLPEPFAPHNTGFQRQVAHALHDLPRGDGNHARRGARGPGRRPAADRGTDAVAAWEHPVADCPDRDEHLRAARQLDRAEREIADLQRQISSRTDSLALAFDRILQLLDGWGYTDGWGLSSRGEQLVRIFHESDLLIAECLESGLFDGLEPASLAGVVSCFTYEHRSPNPPPPPWYPNRDVRDRIDEIMQIAADLNADEKHSRLPLTRPPDPSFFALAHGWAAGESLVHVLEEEELSGGDFVRNIKQLIDLLRQIGDAAEHPDTARAARMAADRIYRGVVRASSAISAGEDEGEDPDDLTLLEAPGPSLPSVPGPRS